MALIRTICVAKICGMNNIKKIYQHAGKCDAQQNLKDIIDAVILSSTC